VVTDYVVMFPADNEAVWEAGTEADHQATFDTDQEFARLLKARGGAVTGGAGLTHSSKARTIKRGPASSSSPATTTTRLLRQHRSSHGLTQLWRSDRSTSPEATESSFGHPLIGMTALSLSAAVADVRQPTSGGQGRSCVDSLSTTRSRL
jgi:hypothetical protein